MKHYLSFGGGVNSVALYLLMAREGYDFEAIFVNHGTDWPETYEYFNYFQTYLKRLGLRPVTEIIPDERGFNSLYDYCWEKRMVPCITPRWCTRQFKVSHVNRYVENPCFMHIGIDFGEAKRAKLSIEKGIEKRYLLIEHEIDRGGCVDLVNEHGLDTPQKSGCWICPFQSVGQWKNLRRDHPCLFADAVALEKRNIEYRIGKGKAPLYLSPKKISLEALVGENQMPLFEQDEYPPCECGL